jgi:hypothetical protein
MDMRREDVVAPIWFFSGWLIAGTFVAGEIPGPGTRVLTPSPPIERRDPDSLSARELRGLPGIGPARALAIARARWDGLRGGPAAWESIAGIGEATVEAAADALSGAALEPPSQPAYTPGGNP